MASLSTLFPEVQRQLLMLQNEFGMFESGADRSPGINQSIQSNLQSINQSIYQLEQLVSMEGSNRRDIWKQKVSSIQSQALALTQSYYRINQSIKQAEQAREIREQLLESNNRSVDGSNRASILANLSRENDSLIHSTRMMDEMINQSTFSLKALARQRDHLKSVQRKARDVASSLGLSSSVIRLIERTETFNAVIVAAGCTLTTGVLFACWWYLRS